LIVAACGDDDDDNATATTTEAAATTAAPATTAASATTTAPATTEAAATTAAPATTQATASTAAAAADKEPVTVIALFDLTGPSPTSKGSSEVTQATVDAINTEGGLNGHPIELQIVDTKGDPAAALAGIADGQRKNPIAWLESSPSTETASSDALAATNTAVIGTGYSPSVWGGGFGADLSCAKNPAFCAKPNHMTITTTFGAVVAEQVLGAQAAGATTLGVAACAEVDSCSSAGPVFDAVAQAVGLKSVGTTKVSTTAADYSAECIAWIQQGVDFIQISGASSMGVHLMSDCADQGYEGIWGASAGTVSGDLIKQPYTLAGGVNAFPWWVDDAPVAKYRDTMDAAGVTPELYSGPAMTGLYSSLLLLQKAVADHADPDAPLDAAAVLDAFYQVTDESLDGLIAPVTFTADNLDRNRPCFWPYSMDPDNNFTNPLGGLEYQCFPPQS
jgi:branched-chain amino acid transport system substrate-binding protein